METKRNPFNKAIGLLLLLGLMLASCTPSADELSGTEVVPTIVTSEPETPATIEPTAVLTPTLTVMPTPTLIPGSVATLPDELKSIMDATHCPRACYLGFMTGQTKDEVLTILQSLGINNPEIDDEEDEEGLTSISWAWPWRQELWLLRYISYRYGGSVVFLGDRSIFFRVEPRELIPISLILEHYGEPDYLHSYGIIDEQQFGLEYLHQDTIIAFSAFDPQIDRTIAALGLTANTLLQHVYIEEVDSYFTWACQQHGQIMRQAWKGYGGKGVYYDAVGQAFNDISVVECDDYSR